jgi:HEAT repeat protein
VVAPSSTTQTNYSTSSPRIDQLLAQLSSTQEHVRCDTAMDLGRLKATKAVDSLQRMLANDASPVAREAAARALGLIGSAQSLNALIRAAQLDTDRDVRHSAQFAVEIIRTILRGN